MWCLVVGGEPLVLASEEAVAHDKAVLWSGLSWEGKEVLQSTHHTIPVGGKREDRDEYGARWSGGTIFLSK